MPFHLTLTMLITDGTNFDPIFQGPGGCRSVRDINDSGVMTTSSEFTSI